MIESRCIGSQRTVLSSSAVERSAVNRLVASSNLAWGAFIEIKNKRQFDNLSPHPLIKLIQLKNGYNWEDLPRDLFPYSTVYWHYKQWRAAGSIEQLMETFRLYFAQR